jgi:hypothetical protein
MGKQAPNWATFGKRKRMERHGSEALEPRGVELGTGSFVLTPGQKGSARLEAYLSKPLPPLPDPVDWLGERLALTPREQWLRDILDACHGD